MPRVAHVISTPSGVGGAERVLASLVRAAGRRGWEPIVINPFASDPANSELAELCRPAPYLGRHCARPHQLPALWVWLSRRLAAVRPDIVHAHLFHASVAVASLPPGLWRSALLTHHHGDHLVYLKLRLRASLDRRAGRRYDRVVAISEATRRFLTDEYAYPEDRLSLIRNGWDGQPRPHVGGDTHPTVICVANLRRQKGHLTLVRAFAQVRHRLPEARLVLVGDGELRSELELEISRLGLGDSVRLTGPVADVWEELARADVFALASLYEPLGVAVIEAMAAGLPVVATAVGGVPELVEPERTGRLVSPGDAAALADAVTELLSSPELRALMRAAARAAAARMHGDVMTDQYLALYESLLDGAGSRRR